MYNARRMDIYFCGVLNKFNHVAKNHTKNKKKQRIHCPCKACRKLRVFIDPTTIRLHVLVSGFAEDYMIWKYHSETNAASSTNSPLDEIMQDKQFDRMFDAYDDFDDGGSDDGGVGGFHGDDVDDGRIDTDSSDDELNDGDFLSQLLHHTIAELLVGSFKGLANLKAVQKSREDNVYQQSKGFSKQCTMLRFIHELLSIDSEG